MIRRLLALLVLLTALASAPSLELQDAGDAALIAEVAALNAQPDPRLARPLDRWPNEADLARLQSVKGKPKGTILRVLDHPNRVELRPNGDEVWDYPWLASCRVWIRNGVCYATDYDAGF
jgi:hypothetical protein